MGVFKLLEFAAQMNAAAGAVEEVTPKIIESACVMIAGKAKDLIGVPNGHWPPLSAETLARKGNVNTPLLETGAMRDSIALNADTREGYVGTNDPKAAFQEYGTARGIPPRPFIGGALNMESAAIEKMGAKMLNAAVNGALGGGRSELAELLHLAHRSFEKAKDAFLDTVHEGDE